MVDLAHACVEWAQQFASDKIAIRVNEDCFDQDYGKFVQIQIIPTALDKARIEIMVSEQSIGFTVECWDRLTSRVVSLGLCASGGARVADRVAAFQEPGAAPPCQTARLLDAIARGDIEVQARAFRSRLVGSGACIRVDSDIVSLQGPATGADMLRLVGAGKSVTLKYLAWIPKMSSLTERVVDQVR